MTKFIMMGKVIERVRIKNVFEPGKSIEVDALIDTGATMVVLPQDIVHTPMIDILKRRKYEAYCFIIYHFNRDDFRKGMGC